MRVVTIRGLTLPAGSAWIEYSYDNDIDELGHFLAEWEVPDDPPDPNNNAINFLFPGIQPQGSTNIIQPVLEWNQASSGRWTGRAWSVWNNNQSAAWGTARNCSEGDDIVGFMYKWSSTYWYVLFYNSTTGQTSYLLVHTSKVPFEDVAAVCALEGYNITDDDDVPGDTLFTNMVFKDDFYGSNVDITWQEAYGWFPQLGHLEVDINSDSEVELETEN